MKTKLWKNEDEHWESKIIHRIKNEREDLESFLSVLVHGNTQPLLNTKILILNTKKNIATINLKLIQYETK